MVKDFSWNIPWNAFLFEKTLKQYQFSIARITNLFWTNVMTRQNVRKQEWVFPFISPDSDDRLSLNFHRFVIVYRSCDTLCGPWTILFTERVQWLSSMCTTLVIVRDQYPHFLWSNMYMKKNKTEKIKAQFGHWSCKNLRGKTTVFKYHQFWTCKIKTI